MKESPIDKDSTAQNVICPLITLALLIALVILPWFTLPVLSLPTPGSLLKLPSLYDGVLNSEIAVDGNRALVAFKDMFAGIGVFDIIGIIIAIIVCALLFLSATVIIIVAIIRGIRSGIRKGIGSSKIALVLLALTQLIGILSILAFNARLTGELNHILLSQGIAEMPITIIAPTPFIWALLGATVICFIVFTIIGSHAQKKL